MSWKVFRTSILLQLLLFPVIASFVTYSVGHKQRWNWRKSLIGAKMAMTRRESLVSMVFPSLVFTGNSSSTDRGPLKSSGTNLPIISLEQAASLSDVQDYTFPMGHWPDKILRHSSSKVNSAWFRSRELHSVAAALKRTARFNHAAGLAAQQWSVSSFYTDFESPHC